MAHMLFWLLAGLMVVMEGAGAVAATRDEGCGVAGACKGGFTPESLLLQVERGSGSSVQRALPELPAPYSGQVGHHISHGHGAALAQLDSPSHPAALPQLQFDSPSAKELEHFRLLKQLRTRGFRCVSKSFQGIPNTEATFKFDCRLWRAARQWSAEMGSKNFFSHVRGDSNPCKRTSEQGFATCTENIAAGNDSPAETLEQFKKSDGHCKNMMDPDLNRFGAGYVETSGSEWTHYWTQSMGTDGQSPDQSCLQGMGSAPSPTAPARRRSDPAPTAACKDNDMNCATSYKQYCSTDRMKKICPKTCGVCQSSAPVTAPARRRSSQAPTGACKDNDVNCATSYKQYCSADHIKRSCPKTCGVC